MDASSMDVSRARAALMSTYWQVRLHLRAAGIQNGGRMLWHPESMAPMLSKYAT